MNYISAENISKSYEDKWLFKEVAFGLSRGQKVALIGINGSGKSTLLKVLAGVETPDSGLVAINKDITVGYLDQDPQFGNAKTVKDALFDKENPILQIVGRYEEAVNNPDDSQALQTAMEEMDAANAWDFEQRVNEVIGKIGVAAFDQVIATLSGGQKKRIALAKLLIAAPDLLILDEPTNHLDVDTIEWLQDFFSTQNTTLLMVTHDRYFLEAVTNEIVELDSANLYRYQGNYSYFLEKKAERQAISLSETDKAKNLMRKELDWIRRQPKARGTKAKYRVDAFEDLKVKATTQQKEQKIELQVKTSRQGKKIIEIDAISKAFGDKKLIENFSYIFRKHEKIGIVGKNGTGKSTFLNLITGKLKPDEGTIALGETTKIGYYKQEGLSFKADQRVIDIVKEVAEVISLDNGTEVTASRFLEFFGFNASLQYSFVKKLSGGERKRLQLLRVLMANPNFLILDEPSNDLDLVTLNVLEDFLQTFGGCLLVVTHDRYFLDQLADHLFIFEGNGVIRDFNGNYTDYRNWVDETEVQKKRVKVEKPIEEKQQKQETQKMSFKEKRELEDLEKEIQHLEDKKETFIGKLNAGEGNHEQLAEWSGKIEALIAEIEEKTFRWMELGEKANQ